MKIRRRAEAELTEKRSRFYALLATATTESEVKALLAHRRKQLRKACHHCWACRFPAAHGAMFEQARDDGEVGRPGMKLLEMLRRRDLEGMIVVSRVFGGVKLGPGGGGRAFSKVAEVAAKNLEGGGG